MSKTLRILLFLAAIPLVATIVLLVLLVIIPDAMAIWTSFHLKP